MDWDRALELAQHARDNERNRLERIEGKIAPVIAGTLAALGLFVDKASSTVDLVFSALLLFPLWMLLEAFRTADFQDVPNVEELVKTYAWYPKTYVQSLVSGTAEALAYNQPIIDKKARDINFAMRVLFATIIVLLIWRIGEATYHQYVGTAPVIQSNPAPPVRSPAPAGSAHR